MTDTQPARAIGAYGVAGLHTPNLDALAVRGVRFDRAYTSCPVCTPARAGIFTGMMPSSTGAWANDMPLGSNVATLGQRLQRHGYRTAYVGQWHLDGHDYFGAGESPPGWKPEYWYDGLRYLSDLSVAQRALWRCGLRSAEAIRQAGIDADFTWAHRSVDRAVAFMAAAGDAPYLLAVSLDEPHEPSPARSSTWPGSRTSTFRSAHRSTTRWQASRKSSTAGPRRARFRCGKDIGAPCTSAAAASSTPRSGACWRGSARAAATTCG